MSIKLELLREAIVKNELIEFMTGAIKKYYFVCPYSDMPTDSEQVFDAFKEYYSTTNDKSIWIKFQNALIAISNDSEMAWLSLDYLIIYLYYREHKKNEFIDLELVIASIIRGVKDNKEKLMLNKKWSGIQFENGQWDNSKRLIQNINEEFNLKISVN